MNIEQKLVVSYMKNCNQHSLHFCVCFFFLECQVALIALGELHIPDDNHNGSNHRLLHAFLASSSGLSELYCGSFLRFLRVGDFISIL